MKLLTATLLLWFAAGSVDAGSPQQSGQSPSTARDHAADVVELRRDLVTLDVTIQDAHGRFVPGIDKSRFEVYDDGIRQAVDFFGDRDGPATIGIIYDVSSSMEGRLDRSRVALGRFLEMAQTDDEFFLVTFGDQLHLARDFTTDGAAVARSLSSVTAAGGTTLYDAVYLGLAKVKQGRHSRRALLVITDGEDTKSRYTFGELHEASKEADALIYVIAIVDLLARFRPAANGLALVDELTATTGGRLFVPANDDDLIESCVTIALELRHQYSIGYYPTGQLDEQRWHKLRVKVTPVSAGPRLKVRARQGYYGSGRFSESAGKAPRPRGRVLPVPGSPGG